MWVIKYYCLVSITFSLFCEHSPWEYTTSCSYFCICPLHIIHWVGLHRDVLFHWRFTAVRLLTCLTRGLVAYGYLNQLVSCSRGTETYCNVVWTYCAIKSACNKQNATTYMTLYVSCDQCMYRFKCRWVWNMSQVIWCVAIWILYRGHIIKQCN